MKLNAWTKSPKIYVPALITLALLVALAVKLFVSGVPDDAVARVGDRTILVKDFNKFQAAFLASRITPGAKTKPVSPDPPDFVNCVAAKKRTAMAGAAKSTGGDYKAECKGEWDEMLRQIMTQLIEPQWYRQEAEQRNIKVSDVVLQQRFGALRTQTFPSKKKFELYLKATGLAERDLLDIVEVSIIQEQIKEKLSKNDSVSAQDVAAYYAEHKQAYAIPASRDLRAVFSRSKAKAVAARSALDAGGSWADVAKRYSTDPASKIKGGRWPGVVKSQVDPQLGKAIFGARKNVIVGPVKGQNGYYVFVVEKAKKGRQRSFAEVKAEVEQAMKMQGQQKEFETFSKKFRAKWIDQTTCADGYLVEQCENGPTPKK